MAEPDHDPSRDSNAVELADRDPASAAAPPGSHSGGSNTEISHQEDVTETTETTAKVTTTNADAAIEEGGVNAEKGVSRLEERNKTRRTDKLIRLLLDELSRLVGPLSPGFHVGGCSSSPLLVW